MSKMCVCVVQRCACMCWDRRDELRDDQAPGHFLYSTLYDMNGYRNFYFSIAVFSVNAAIFMSGVIY